MLYSKSTHGFYTRDHAATPADATEISDELYAELLNGQATGGIIACGIDGIPYITAYAPSAEEARAAKQAEIRDKADVFLAALAQEYGAYEKLTWDQQAIEADALAADPLAPAPLVRSIAAARNMDPIELAARIRANRAQWVVLSGSIVGQRLAYQDALDAAQTVEAVNAINPVYGL